MKIVLATPLYPPEHGGPATYAEALVQGVLGDDVRLVKFSDVRHLPSGIRHLAYFWNVYRAAYGMDVILALDPVSVGFPAILAAWLARKPFVVKIVGDFAWEQGTQRSQVHVSLDQFVRMGHVPFSIAVLRVVQNFVAHHARKIIVPSEYLKGIVTQWGIAPEKISVIYNSIEVPQEIVDSTTEHAENVVISVGRLVHHKNVDGVIDAVANVRKEIPDTKLMIVGDGPERESLEKKGTTLLGDSVRFMGALRHEDTLRAIQASGVLVLNSSYEGLSHLLIEAATLGAAIVATNVGGNPEVITDGETGVLVPVSGKSAEDAAALAAAITRVLKDHELRARIRARAKESSARFSRTEMLAQTTRLLSSVTHVSF